MKSFISFLKAHKRSLGLILEGCLFLLSALCIYLLTWFILQRVTSTDMMIGKNLPYILSLCLPVYLLVVVHLLLYPTSRVRKRLTFIANGATMVAIGAAIVILDVSYLLAGIFPSLCFGGINALYPLDTLLNGFLFELIGLGLFHYGLKKYPSREEGTFYPIESKASKVILHSILFPIYIGFSLFFTGDILYFFHTFDYECKNLACTIPMYCLMALLPIELGLYEFYLRRKEGTSKYISAIFKGLPICLLLGLAFSLWGYFALLNTPLAFAESMFGLFPIDGEASLAFGPLLLYAFNIVPPLAFFVCFIKSGSKEPRPIELDEKKEENK